MKYEDAMLGLALILFVAAVVIGLTATLFSGAHLIVPALLLSVGLVALWEGLGL